VRYALKLATGTGKTVVMGLPVTWATLHKRKVSGSSLSANFLVLAPNLTVHDRVSGVPRGDGLSYSGEHNLYDAFDMAPPEYHDEFHPNVMVRNWQGIPLEGQREDWIGEEGPRGREVHPCRGASRHAPPGAPGPERGDPADARGLARCRRHQR
jgi:type III restriction enzyme